MLVLTDPQPARFDFNLRDHVRTGLIWGAAANERLKAWKEGLFAMIGDAVLEEEQRLQLQDYVRHVTLYDDRAFALANTLVRRGIIDGNTMLAFAKLIWSQNI